jgi:hypothetical protein
MTMTPEQEERLRKLDQEFAHKCAAAQARADRITDIFTRCNGIALRNTGRSSPGSELFHHCMNHPELPDDIFMEWLVQAYAAPAGKRRQLWRRIQQAHGLQRRAV